MVSGKKGGTPLIRKSAQKMAASAMTVTRSTSPFTHQGCAWTHWFQALSVCLVRSNRPWPT